MRLKQCIFALVAMLLCAFSANAQESVVAKIGNAEYTTFASAMAAANAATGNVEVEVYGAVEFTDGMELNGSYTAITFTGKNEEAKITINQTAGGDYLTAHDKTVAFNDLILAKANPAWSDNSAHMGNYFSIQGGTVTYTDCTFPNGACTNTGTAVYNNCTFENASEYGLWVYDDALVTVNGGTIDSKKGIKVYSEGEESVTSTLTVQNATFTENVTAKPAVAVGYAQSITLIGNTYNNTTAHVELDSGSDADCEGITFVAQDSEGNDIASTLEMTDRSNSSAACGVLVDGKIYTTVTTAAAEATSGSTVTLLYNTNETVELPEGVTLDRNGNTAENVTIKVSGPVEVATYDELVAALANGGNIKLTADITVDTKITAIDGTELDLNEKTLYINVENSYYNNVTIKNGNIVIGKDDVTVCDGYFLVNAGKTLVLDGVNMSSSAEGIKGYAVFHLYTGANLDLLNSTLNIADNEYSAGYIVYAGESTATVDIVKTTITGSKVNGIVHATTVIDESTVTLTNVIEHGINRSGVTIDDSNVAISGGTGRGITAQHGDLVITGNSTVDIKDMGEATIELRNDKNLSVAETANVTLDVAVNNTTSGTISGTVTVPAYVAMIGEQGYETLAAAVEYAKAGDVVTLIRDVEANEVILIDKSLTINGNGHKVTSSATRVFRVTTANTEVTLDGVNMVSRTVMTYPNDIRGISIDIVDNVKLTLNNSSVDFTDASACDWAYAVNVTGGNNHVVTVNGGAYEGANVINVRGANNTVTVKNATLTSLYPNNDLYYGACIWVQENQGSSVEATGNTFNGSNAFAFNLGTGTNLTESGNTDNTEYVVAKIGAEYYTSLADAFAAGGEVKVLQDIVLAETATVPAGKEVVLDLNGKKVTSTAKKAFEVHANATIKNGAIEAAQRCVDTRKAVELTLTDVTLIADEYTTHGNPQPLTIGGYDNGTQVTMENVEINAGTAGYGIITFVETELTATNSTIGGYNALYVKPGSDNSTFNFVDSDLSGSTVGNDVEGNSFSVIAVRAKDVIVNVDDASTVTATGNYSYAISFKSKSDIDTPATGSSVTVAGEITGNILADLNGNTVRVNAEYADELQAAGYATIEPENGLVAVIKPVAQVGETKYATLEEAFAAVQDNGTVTLLADVTYTKATGFVNGSYVDGLVYTGDKNFTVDFADHTITENGEINDYLVYLKNTGEKNNEITFKNGTIAINSESTATAWAAITVGSNSSTHKTTLNLNGMKVINGNPNAEGNQVISSRNGATVNLNEGTTVTSNGTSYGVVAKTASTLNINSGAKVVHTNSGTTGGNLVYTAVSGNGTINIYDGAVIESDKYGIHNMTTDNAVINIYGGTITAPVAVHAATNGGAGETATVNIKGGTINGVVEEYTNTANIHVSGGTFTVDVSEFCAEGFVCEANGDDTYGVVVDPAYGKVAQVGDAQFETLSEAVAAAQAGEKITLIADVELTETLNIPAGKTIALDLNGKTISQTKEQTAGYQMILNDGNLTIDDSSEAKTGKISYTDSGNGGEYISDVIYNRGVLVINGGTIENLSSATVASNGYPHAVDTYSGIRDTYVEINGGTIYCAEYSAIRMFCVSATNKADLVINGGTIKGAIDMQNGTKNLALGTLTINNGTFETTKNANNIRFANWNGGATEYGISAEIKGGSFNGGITTAYVPAAANWDKGVITGGTFAKDMTEYCAEGFVCEENENGTYGIVADPSYIAELTIDDAEGEDYTYDTEKTVGTLTYVRTLPAAGIWYPVFLPFDVPVDALDAELFDVARINDFHTNFSEEDGSIEKMWVEYIVRKSGTLAAGRPFLVRAKSSDNLDMVIELENAKLYPADKKSTITVSSVITEVTFEGVYESLGAPVSTPSTRYLAVNANGVWDEFDGYSLNPFRVMMTLKILDEEYYIGSTASLSVGARVIGEENEDGTTTIYDVEVDCENDGAIYDLQGRRVLETEKGGMYIVNGKKVLVK